MPDRDRVGPRSALRLGDDVLIVSQRKPPSYADAHALLEAYANLHIGGYLSLPVNAFAGLQVSAIDVGQVSSLTHCWGPRHRGLLCLL